MKNHAVPDAAFTASAIGTIAGWQEQLDWTLRFLVLAIAGAAGLVSLLIRIRELRRKWRHDRVLERTEESGQDTGLNA